MVKAIIFDFDMTLLDSSEFGTKVREDLAEHGISCEGLSEAEIWGSTHERLCQRIAELNGNKLDWQEISRINADSMERHYSQGELKEIKFLRELNERGILLGIVSGNKVRTIKKVLKNEKNNAKFAFVLCPEDEYSGKTKAELLKEAMSLFNIDNNECAYVGDHPNDIMAAKRAEVISVGITTGCHDAEKLKGFEPDIVIEKLNDLARLF
jgi:HAD superfamily hydrolase (TIGR01549 family)